MPTQFSNTAVETTLDGGIDSSVVTLDVDDAAGYPDPPFNIQIDDEVIRVGAKSSVTFSSLTRGYDDTTAASHSAGTKVSHVVIAEDLRTSAFQTDTWLDAMFHRPSGETIHADDDEFDDGSIGAEWTEVVGGGTTTWTETLGRLHASTVSQAASDINGLMRPLNGLSAPVTVDTLITITTENSLYSMFGVGFSDGVLGTSNIALAMPYVSSSDEMAGDIRGGTFEAVSGSFTTTEEIQGFGPLYLRFVWSASNQFKMFFSHDGVNWLNRWGTTSRTINPTHFGVFVSSWGSSVPRMTAFEYVRITESDLS